MFCPAAHTTPKKRTKNSGVYRFGFNGMEKIDEWQGDGNSYDFGARIYDPRIGRWLACDPQSSKYPSWSPYGFSLSSPVQYNDPNGEWVEKTVTKYYTSGYDANGEPIYEVKKWYHIFKKTTKKEVHLRVHNVKLYNLGGTFPTNGMGSPEAPVTNEQMQEMANNIKNLVGVVFGTPDNPYVNYDESGTVRVETSVEIVGEIEIINSLDKVKFGRKGDDLIVLVNDASDYIIPGLREGDEGGLSNPGYHMMVVGLKTDPALVARTVIHEWTHSWTNTDAGHEKEYTPPFKGSYGGKSALFKQQWSLDRATKSGTRDPLLWPKVKSDSKKYEKQRKE